MEMQEELIRNKVTELGSAIFHNVSDAPKMISTSLISSVKYDEEGRIYFFTPRPQFLVEDDMRFPAVLDFYKKGKPYFIKLNGVAELVTNDTELHSIHIRHLQHLSEPAGRSSYALVRFNVERVEYTAHDEKPYSFFDRLRAAIHSWF